MRAVDKGRVRVRMLGGDDDGKLQWVSRQSLYVPWAEVERWQVDESRAAVLALASPRRAFDDPEYIAVTLVLSVIDGAKTTQLLPLHVRLVESNPVICHWAPDLLLHPGSFIDRFGDLHGPWLAAIAMARLVCDARPEAVIAAVQSETEVAEQAALVGYRPSQVDVLRDRDVASHRAYLHGPHRDATEIVRGWLGRDVGERFDELVALRAEVARLGHLVERSAKHLRDCGRHAVATALLRDLGALPPGRVEQPKSHAAVRTMGSS